ncbi:MAG: ca2+ sensor protein [Pseudomonadota bacterium]
MNKPLFAAGVALLMSAGALPAAAQDAPPPPGPGGMLMRADANHDGVVSRDELLADVDLRFAAADANHDGKITADEREAMRGPGRGGRMGGRADTDGDGAISLAEQRAQAMQRFDMIDANHDGKVDQPEQDSMRERMRSMRGADGGPPPPPPPADAPSPPNGN